MFEPILVCDQTNLNLLIYACESCRGVRIVNPGPPRGIALRVPRKASSRIGAVIHTADTDFVRFSGGRWLNPRD